MNRRRVSRLSLTVVLGVALAALAPLAAGHNFGGNSGAGAGNGAGNGGPPCGGCSCAGAGGGAGGGGGGGSGGGAGSSGPGGTSGSPISYFDGGENLTATDLELPGDFPIVVIRKYDSQSAFDSAVGASWALLLDRRLYEYPDGSVVVRHGCGVRDKYVLSGGSYVSPAGGMLATLVAVSGGYELRYVNGTTDYFDSLGRLFSFRSARGARHEYSYDSRGRLPLVGSSKASVNPLQPVIVGYSHRITRIDERAANGSLTGRFVTFAYNDTTGRLLSVTANDGRSVSYVHDTSGSLTTGNLIQVNMLDGQVATYGYTDPHDPHNVTTIVEAVGRTPVVNVYDAQDRVIQQTEGSRSIAFNYETPFVRTIVTRTIRDHNGLNPYNTVTTYEFDESSRITKITTPLGHEERYTYSPGKVLTKKEVWQRNGGTLSLLQTINWTHNTAGQVLTESVTLDSGEVVTKTWTYNNAWVESEQVVSSAAPAKVFRTEYTFNLGAGGQPVGIASERRRKDDGSFQVTSFTYDSRNRLLTTTLPDGVKRVHEYTGDFVSRTYYEVGGLALPQMDLRFEYDSDGRLVSSRDARNNVSQFTYDDRGRLISQTNPLGQQDLWTYTSDLLTQVERGRTVLDGEGQVVKYVYDSRGRLTQVQRKSDAGTFVTFETMAYDSENRLLLATDALNRVTSTAYDLDGRIASVTDPLAKQTRYFYDAANNMTRVRDALLRDTDYEFDDLNRVAAVVERAVSPNIRTETTYDAAGNLTSIKDGENRTTAYAFDALSRNTRITQPLGQEILLSYDNRDRVDVVTTARNQRIDYDYESWGPVKQERQFPTLASTIPDRTITYARDPDGNVTSITDSGVQIDAMVATTYDALGRPFDETVKYLPGGDRVLQHRYDRYGNRDQINVTGVGATTNGFVFNKLNRITTASLGGATVGISYFANDDQQTVTFPNGVSRSYTYEANGPIDTIAVIGTSGPIAQWTYEYDDVLNVDAQTDFDGLHDYGYDVLNRVTTGTHPVGSGLPLSESFVFSPVGNRRDSANPSAWTFDNNHRITAAPGVTYAYDADGNLLSRSDALTLTHDARQRLVQVLKSGVSSSYLQDSSGRRIRKTVAGSVTWFLWDGARLIAEFDASGTRTKRYAYLDGYAPAQMEDGNGVYYVHADHLDTPRVLTNGAGQVVWRSRQELYGRATVQEDADGNGQLVSFNVRFPGQYFDGETGFHQNYLRDYDPSIGRYLQADPIGLAGGLNPYAYVDNDPIGLFDDEGLEPKGGHSKGARPSSEGKHQKAESRRGRDQRSNSAGGEKGDRARRPPSKRPDGHKGPWPPKPPKPPRPPALPKPPTPKLPGFIPPMINPCIVAPDLMPPGSCFPNDDAVCTT